PFTAESASIWSSLPVRTMIGTVGEWAYTLVKVSRPKLSGSERSSSTRPVPPADRCSRPSARRSAQCRWKGVAGSSAIISSMSRASPGLSSMRRTLCGVLMAVGRQRDDGQPEHVDASHHDDELFQIDRLGDVAVGV